MRRLALAALLSLAALPGCSKGCGKSGSGDKRARVVVSIFPVYDLVRRVAGSDADVTLVVPPGRTEHGFEPRPEDAAAARGARLGVMVGLGLDPWMEAMMKDAAPAARILKVADRVPTIPYSASPLGAVDHEHDGEAQAGGAGQPGDRDADAKGGDDPHVWLDPQRAQLIVRAVAEELGRVDAPHALAYRDRATTLDASLVALDKEAQARIEALARKGFVPFHAAFGYFAERYRMSIVAVVEPRPGVPPTPDTTAKLLAVIRDARVSALFSEPELDAGPVKALADQAKIPVGVLDPLGGSPDSDSYEKTIRNCVTQLERYLR